MTSNEQTGIGLARIYRPRKFKEAVGQETVIQAIQNAFANNHPGAAYLFFGPRGVGKTSLARLIARRINCQNLEDSEPCGECQSCQAIENGQSMDVIEIDAASHRGIDHIRELRENLKFRPMAGNKKVYIIDEVHMLTQESFNALLKSLEEPPSHVLFVFATTEYHKVPQTILSRCQGFNLKRVSMPQLQERLAMICQKEGVSYDEESLFWIARAGDGSLRDSISFLEQSIHYCQKKLEAEKVQKLLGHVSYDIFLRLTRSLLEKDTPLDELLAPVQESFTSGIDLQRFIWEYLDFIRVIIYIKRGILDSNFLGISSQQVKEFSDAFAHDDTIQLSLIFHECFGLLTKFYGLNLHNSYEMRVLAEIEFVCIKEKLTRPSISGVLQKLNQLSATFLEGKEAYSFEHELQKQFLGTVIDPNKAVTLANTEEKNEL